MENYLLPLIGLLAFFLKGVIGTGPSTVIVALSSLIIDPKSAIVLASFVNIIGGFRMAYVDPLALPSSYWKPIATTMIIGSILGALALKFIPSRQFEFILGIAFLLTAIWFILKKPKLSSHESTPHRAGKMDLFVGTFAGFCGGFIGANAPPLILHFSRFLDKARLRRLLVLIFIPAAIAQTGTFMFNGLLTKQIIVWGILLTPTVFIGISLGQRAFNYVSETWYKRALGVLLLIVSVRLILRSLA